MDTARANANFCSAFIDELARLDVGGICLCPGSRSTPLATALVQNRGLRHWTHLDERSAAFFALGVAKRSRRAVAVLCSSGSAAANFLPAAVEAHYARVPLLLLTADRPHELRDSGAPQAIDQIRLFGAHVKWFIEMPLPEDSAAAARYARIIAARAVATAIAAPAGPVHLNFPFREPFLSEEGESSYARPRNSESGATLSVSSGRRAPSDTTVQHLAGVLRSAERGLVVCGGQDDADAARAIAELAVRLQFPLLADPLSQTRCGTHDRTMVVAGYDGLLQSADFSGAMVPEVVLRVGALPTSKPLVNYLDANRQARQIFVDGGEGWNDSGLTAGEAVHADPLLLCGGLCEALAGWQPSEGSVRWADLWLEADRRAADAIRSYFEESDEFFEARIFTELAALLPAGFTLFAGNSMPVRDLDGFFPSLGNELRFLANRGANGIDGVISSALGAATLGPLMLVIGDLSFYHDSNGLLAARRFGIDATIILINNDGGGIFSFLPQAERSAHFEELFGTPHGLDLSHLAHLHGARHVLAEDWSAFRRATSAAIASPGLDIIEVRTRRGRNVELHREAGRRIAEAIAPMLALARHSP